MRRRDVLKHAAFVGAMSLPGFCSSPLAANASMPLRVPGEEHRHEATFMQWPVSRQVYSNSDDLAYVQNTIADIANMIAAFEPVIMLADKQYHAEARRKLSAEVELWDIPTDDLWCRDSGPLFALRPNGERVVSHIQFNGWGQKQRADNDRQIARRVAHYLDMELEPSQVVGEAGGAEQDGHGLLIAHESSWIDTRRNPGFEKAEIEQRLLRAYGANKLIWAPGVSGQDITDYHIDGLARFSGPGKLIMTLPDQPDEEDAFHLAALQTYEILKNAGLEIDIIPDPLTPRIKDHDFVAAYANYYVCNQAVIAAEFGDQQTDKIARDALQQHYPEREIITMNVDALGQLGGGIHCATQQLPVSG